MSHTRIFSVAPRLMVWLCALAGCLLLYSAPAFAKEVHVYESSFGSEGSGPGQFREPLGVAVNDTTHDVYVVDSRNNRVEEFNATGTTLLAEFNGAVAPTGAFSEPTGIAIDNSTNPLDPSKEDVYVIDQGHGVIDKFDSSGTYIGQLTGTDTPGGPFEPGNGAAPRGPTGVAIDPSGTVWVGIYQGPLYSFSNALDNGYASQLVTGFGGVENGLAVDGEDNLYLIEGLVAKVNSVGATLSDPFGGDGKAFSGAVDPSSGEVYLDSRESIEAFDPTGTPIENFGSGHLTLSAAMAVDASNGNVYATDRTQDNVSLFEAFQQPTVTIGPLSGQSPRAVTLNGTVDPEGKPVNSCVFEYGTTSAYGQSVPCSPASLGTGSASVPVSAQLTGLVPETVYHYRLSAENGAGKSSTEDIVLHTGPIFGGESVSEVASTSATLEDAIDPNGADTHYYIQYGPTTAYGSYAPVPAPGVDLGNGAGTQSLSVHIQNLQAGTLYHYSFVAVQDGEIFEEADQTFTTQPPTTSYGLTDGRSWELVSPPNKKGAVLELTERGGQVQAADDGSGIAYVGEGPTGGENQTGKLTYFQALSRRGPNGWQTADVSLPGGLPENGEPAEVLLKLTFPYHLFSPDLTSSVVEPQPFGTPPLSSEERERTLYMRNDLTGVFSPLVSPADVPEGTKIEEEGFDQTNGESSEPNPNEWEMHFLTSTPDLAHVVFYTPKALTEDAIDEETLKIQIERKDTNRGHVQENLYEWSAAGIQLVNILPGPAGEVAHGPIGKVPLVSAAGTSLGGLPGGNVQRSISNDGRRIAWTWGEPYTSNAGGYRGLFVRDMVEERTIQIGGASAVYQTMNGDGSKIYYLENGDLFVYDWNSEKATDLTATHGVSEPNAGVQELVSDVSEDGSYVYFVATGVLADGASAGEDNLYVLYDAPGGWTTTYIATLSPQDHPGWYAETDGPPFLADISSRVSPNGHYLAFMSDRALTGYDNTDAASGQPDEELYLYDAQKASLVCASCDPTGGRPVGIFDREDSKLLVDRGEAWTSKAAGPRNPTSDHWLAGSIPGWDNLANDPATYQPRYLSDSGRLFFDSPDALVPQDTNGLEDVYEYEPEGTGNCTSTTATATDVYVKELAGHPVGGCVGLISSGTSSSESAFYDASENGDDVFFDTTSKLVGEDYDKGYDVYDAHVCTTAVPCKQTPILPPPCTSGDSCKAAPSPQPELFGPTPTATFNGVGNIASPTVSDVKPKSLTNAQKLARALRACHRQKNRQRRACERQARKHYPLRRAGKNAATGNRRKGS